MLRPDLTVDMLNRLALPPSLGALVGLVLGAVAGSFLATLVLRWPAGRNLSGRSACDGCGRVLRPIDLVPLLSFLVQQGRCRTCGTTIDRRHFSVEAGCVSIGAVALHISPDPMGFAGALFGWLLMALAALDLEHFWLPDRLTGTLAGLGLLSVVLGLPPPLLDRLIGAVAGFAALWLIGWGYRRARGRVGLGRGDPKLLGGIGLWLGWAALPFVLLGASLAGLAYAAARAVRGRPLKRTDKLPLGMLMAGSAWLVWCLMAARIWPAVSVTFR